MSEHEEFTYANGDVPEDKPATAVAVADAPVKPQFFKVVLTHPNLHSKVVFRSISQERAETWLMNHYPRGSEAHLVSPTGDTTHYEAERQGENGMHADKWASFDPDAWLPVDMNPPPGDSVWADKEG